MLDPLYREIFKKYILERKTVGYYPSAGFKDARILKYPFDILILSDYVEQKNESSKKDFINHNKGTIREAMDRYIFKSYNLQESIITDTLSYYVFKIKNKVYIYFFEDNSITKSRILEAGIKLDAIICLSDGCREKENYECLSSDTWLSDIKSSLKPDGIIIQDHKDGQKYFDDLHFTGGSTAESKNLKKVFLELYPQPGEV